LKANVEKLPATAQELHFSQIEWAKVIDEGFTKWMRENVDKDFVAAPGWPIKN
jgi:hypothetical protein